MQRHPAPWSRSLIVITLVATAACLGASALNWRGLVSGEFRSVSFWMAVVPLAVVGLGALFVVRGYSITPDAVLVHRLIWATRLPRATLVAARTAPHALSVGTRTFGGNGGFYSCCGFLLTHDLGVCRAFVTDPARAVELRFGSRIVIVSPGDPESFVQALRPSLPPVHPPSIATSSDAHASEKSGC